jgi:outer membrane receptor protein involved in Fe transport
VSARAVHLLWLLVPLAATANHPRILANRQGLAQKDLSIRGGSYQDSGLSLNGLPLFNPYSAHFNADLPVAAPLLADPEIQTGLDVGSGHAAGTAAFRLHSPEPQATAEARLGTEERYGSALFGSSGSVGGFIDLEKARKIDYDANGLERSGGGAALGTVRQDWRYDVLATGQRRSFGAQGYYGLPATTYAKECADDALLFAGALKGDPSADFIRAAALVRTFDDKFEIPSVAFRNETQSRGASAMLEGRTLEIQQFALGWRGDLEHQRLHGDLGSHQRTRGSLMLLPELRLERMTLKAGINTVFLSSEDPRWLPAAGAEWFVADNTQLHASYSESVRRPDFQTLYYSDPFRSGNSRLEARRTRKAELSIHQFFSARLDARAGLFYRRQKEASDWVRTAPGALWQATDLGTLDVGGIEAEINYNLAGTFSVQGYYQWVRKEDPGVYAGLYELDYPEHLLSVSGIWTVSPHWKLFGTQVLRLQHGHPVRRGGDFGAEASAGLQYAPGFANNVRLSLLVENLWDSGFQALPGLKPRPIGVLSSIAVIW